MRRKQPPRAFQDAPWHDFLEPDQAGFALGHRPAPHEARLALGCGNCGRRTAFGNCGDPVAAGLADTLRLVAHPNGGRGCPAHAATNEQDGAAYWRVHEPDGIRDVALCPPLPLHALAHRFAQAVRIEPIPFADAWEPPA